MLETPIAAQMDDGEPRAPKRRRDEQASVAARRVLFRAHDGGATLTRERNESFEAGIDAREMLARIAHRIVWVNPRKAAPGYAPLVGGMAAALPYCDAFVSGHSLAALEQVVAAVADDG